jgi:hypothetical protein
MKERKNGGQIAGLTLHILIAALLIFTGLQKILGPVPPTALVKYGLGDQARLIGAGAILTALLLVMPRTSSLGLLLTSSFWGGAICIHMAHGEPYLIQTVFLVLSWAGAYLRNPATPGSFGEPSVITLDMAADSELATRSYPQLNRR